MKILLTKRAADNYKNIKQFIYDEWGDLVSESFAHKTNELFDLLESFPKLGEIEVPDKKIRGFQLTKHTRIFYRIKNNQVIILSFFDVRQDSKKKPS